MKDKLIKELEKAKLQTSKEWLDGFNKGIDRAIELTEANREEELEEIEDGIPTVPSYIATELENISNPPDRWNLEGYTSYLDGEGSISIKDNKNVLEWAEDNPQLFLQLLGGIVYRVMPEVETVAPDPRIFNWDGFLTQKVQKPVEF